MSSDNVMEASNSAPVIGPLALTRLYIHGGIEEINDADGAPNTERFGVNRAMILSNAKGLLVSVFAYVNSKVGDTVRIFSSLDPTPLLEFNLKAGEENQTSLVFLPGNRLEPGFQVWWFEVIRDSQNFGRSDDLLVFLRRLLPGGTDPYPDRRGHYRLLPAKFLNVPASGISKELAESPEGVRIRIDAYPNMWPFDVLTCSLGGHEFEITVKFDEVGKDIESKIPAQVIESAGNGNHIFIWRPRSQIHNLATDWSLRAFVYSEGGAGDLLRALLVKQAEADPDNGELFVDLQKLGTKNLLLSVVTRSPTFAKLDGVTVSVKVIKDGVLTEIHSEKKTVERIDSTVDFELANTSVMQLARQHLYLSYTLEKADTGEILPSSRTAVFLQGVARSLPAPKFMPIDGVKLNPEKPASGVVDPNAGIAAQSYLTFRALGTAPGGKTFLYESGRRVSASQAARPMTFGITAAFLSQVDGGTLVGWYTVGGVANDPSAAESLREPVRVGESQPDLSAVDVLKAPDGTLNPEDLAPYEDAEYQIPVFENMEGHTVYAKVQSDNPNDSQPYEESLDIDPRDVGSPVSLFLLYDFLMGNIGFNVTINYFVEPTDGTGSPRFGADRVISIGAGAGKLLPAPKAIEADENGVVKPGDTAANGLSIVVAEANLENGDHIFLSFDGDAVNGDYSYDRPISQSGAGKPFTHKVPQQYVVANVDSGVRVSYKVERALGGEDVSDALLLSVQRAVLPLIAIAEAEGPNLDSINLDDVPLTGGSAIVNKTALLKAGDVVKIILSNASIINRPIAPADEGRDLIVKIVHSYFAQHNGRSFTASYAIARATGGPDEPTLFKSFSVQRDIGSGTFKVMGARHNSNTYRSSSLSCRMLALDQQTFAPKLVEWRYEGEVVWRAGTDFIDTDSRKELHVRSMTDAVTANPVNVCGNGVDANTAGAASVAVLRNIRVSAGGTIGGRDLSAAGHASYGGAIPANLLIQENLQALHCTGGAYAILTANNDVAAWGEATGGGNMGAVNPSGIKELASNSYAFAALDLNGNVRCWGHAAYGGTLPAGGLSNISQVYNGGLAFVARRLDGSLTGWGSAAAGGVANPAPGIINPKRLICSYNAFAGITQTNRLFAFGDPAYGGNATSVASRTDIERLCCANARAFVALSTTKNAVAWGDANYGGALANYPGIATLQFVDVVSTWHAFAGVTVNNRVAAWGQAPAGVVPANIAALTNVVTIAGTAHAFAVLCADGTVHAWGNAALGGDTSAVSGQLVNVVAIYTNSHGFIALTSDNRVVAWGNATALSGSAVFNGFVSHLKS